MKAPPVRILTITLLALTSSLSALSTADAQHPTTHTAASAPLSSADAAALRAALDAYDRGDIAQAEPALRALTARFPRSYEASEALGSLYAEKNDLAQAQPFLERAAVLAPREPLAHANLGAVYLKLAHTADAVHELQQAATLDPRNASTQANLGQALLAIKQPLAAAKAFAAASDASPADNDLKYDRALALYDSGQNREAAAILDTVPPTAATAEMHALAGDANERAGDFLKALPHFEAAARLDPSDANLYALTVELLRHWNWDEAIKVADFGALRYPASRHFKMASGIAYYGKSDYSPAVDIFATLLQADPTNAGIADLLGRSCTALSDGEKAGCAGIYDFAKRVPGNAVMTTYGAVAILHAAPDRQNLDQAAALLRSAIAADPKYAEAYYEMGVLEQVRLNWAQSATYLEQAVALNPKSAEAHYRLSRAYAHLGRRDEAKQQIALHQACSDQAKQSLDAKLQEVMRFVLSPS